MNFLLAIIVSAAIDSTAIYIGDQTDMHLSATMEPTEQASLPRYGEMLIDGIEIVERTSVDTTVLQDGRVQLNQTLTLTSFCDSLFFIPAQPFVSGEDTLWSDGLSLNVIQPFEIDTTLAITDIKPVQSAPIWWWGIIRWVLLAIGCILLGIGAWYFIKWAMHRKKGGELQMAEVEKRPAEEVALEKLDRIKAEKIWQEGKVKEYQTELTDVIREYIGRRYEVKSTEKTSDETLRELKPLMAEQKELFERLRKMLSLADLVKFAKWHTTPDENESALLTAYDFVNETTAAPAEDEQKEEEDMFTIEKNH